VALWISPELSTAEKETIHPRIASTHAGSMTQDLSAGTSSPQPVPGAHAGTQPVRTPTIQTPATAAPDTKAPAPATPAASTSHTEPANDAAVPAASAAPAQPQAPQAGSAQATATEAKPSGGKARAKKPPVRKAGRRGKARRKPLASRRGERLTPSGSDRDGRDARVAPDAGATAERRIRIGSPESLLAVVPVLLGFQPASSMVVIGTDEPSSEVRLTLRYDLPDPGLASALAGHAMSVLIAQRIQTAVAVGYGPEQLVAPVAAALSDQAHQAGVTITELLRADNQRYWSYVCRDPACCPPEGKPFDVTDHPVARAMAAESGQVLASRDALAATVAPVTGAVARRMREATGEAEEQVARAVARAARSGRKASVRRLIATVGLPAVAEAIRRYRGSGRLQPEEAGWLTVVLRDFRVRDDAWARMRPEHREAHRRLWTDLTRLAQPGYVCAPASLLAFVAWQSGNGALANVALDRALAEDPNYSMAVLLRQAVDSGAPPSLARLPMSPEDVAASYDALEASEETAEETGEENEAVGGPAR